MTDVVLVEVPGDVVVTEPPLSPPDVVFITAPVVPPPTAVIVQEDTTPTVLIIEAITGPQGAQGVQGVQGVQGDLGPPGPRGFQGYQGFQGDPGPQGYQGAQGVQGDIGPQGVQGSVGPQGSVGVQGSTGVQGPVGTQGPQGLTGAGVQGATGVQGPAGVQGPPGTGSQGPQGVTGGSGPQGSQGSPGIPGGTGAQGAPGANGGPGPQGVAGAAGAAGAQGPQGASGVGSQGAQGAAGTPGTPGSQGPQGAQGAQGGGGSGSGGGSVILTGEGPPFSGLGNPGDFYIDTDTDIMYGPKSDGSDPYGDPEYAYPDSVVPDIYYTATPLQLASQVEIAAPGVITGVRYYRSSDTSPMWSVKVWELGTHAVLGSGYSVYDPSPGAAGWATTYLDTPLVVAAGDRPVVSAMFDGVGSYSRGFDMGYPVSNGGSVSISGSSFDGTGADVFPGTDTWPVGFFVDVLFRPDDPNVWPVAMEGGGSVPGPQGPPGTPGGPQGPAGAPGSQGPAGTPGGPQGPQGTTGSPGAQGPAGTGTQGPQGTAGAQGAAGVQGPAGTGAQGPQGAAGSAGGAGPQGAAGTAGGTGPQGATGSAGSTGPQGPSGSAGGTGAQGPAGVSGGAGPQGATGSQGAAGTQGPQGAVGVGTQGAQGAAGAQGPSGSQGVQGSVGVQGGTGAQGSQGAQGSGPQGSAGAQGPQGAAGAPGSQGPQGAQGVVPNLANYLYRTSANVIDQGGSLAVIGSQSAIATGDNTGTLQVQAKTANATDAAYMLFHMPGRFAAYFGVDTDNQWKVGGYSYGANSYKILSEANSFNSVGATELTTTRGITAPRIKQNTLYVGSASGTYTVYPVTGYTSYVIVVGGAITIAIEAGMNYGNVIRLTFLGTNNGVITWPGGVVWPMPTQVAPDLAAGVYKRAVVVLTWDTAYYLANASVY